MTNVWPSAATGDVLLGYSSPDLDATADDPAEGLLGAWDLRTGERLWDLGDRHGSRLHAAAGNIAVVAVAEGGYERDNVVLDVSTGTEITEITDTSRYLPCTSAENVVACAVDGSLPSRAAWVTVDPATGAFTEHGEFAYEVRGSSSFTYHAGMVFTGPSEGKNGYIMDLDGTLLAKDVPGHLVGFADGHAVFLSERDDGETVMVVHEVLS